LEDSSSGVFRPLVPAAFCQPIFNAIHNLAHPGIRTTSCLITSCFVRLCLEYQVAAWCRDCQHCQQAKVTCQPWRHPPSAHCKPHTAVQAPVHQSGGATACILQWPYPPPHYFGPLYLLGRGSPFAVDFHDSCTTALIGSWVSGSESHNKSPPTGVINSALPCGLPSLTG
jgi:hypothetical protein